MASDIKALSENIINKIKRESITPNRQTTSGYVSKTGEASTILDSNGDIQQISGLTNQSKMNNESSSNTDISYEKNIITNRFNLTVDDIVINNSKLNPQLYGLSDIVQQSDNCIQGNLNMIGTVLVKSWDKTLEKFVYIRRYIRTPIMYNKMESAVIDERFGIFSSTEAGNEL